MLSRDFGEQVAQYVLGAITLDVLEEWFLPRVFDLAADPSSDDADLAGAVELALAEMLDGILDEDGVRQELKVALGQLGALSPAALCPHSIEGGGNGITTTSSTFTSLTDGHPFSYAHAPAYSSDRG